MTSKSSVASVAADSNVLLSAAAGRAARRVFGAAPDLRIVTTEINLEEVREYIPRMADKYGLRLRDLERAMDLWPVEVVPEDGYRDSLEAAKGYLQERDPDDIPLAALALSLRIPIWTNDKDFAEIPLPTYTTGQLLDLLGL